MKKIAFLFSFLIVFTTVFSQVTDANKNSLVFQNAIFIEVSRSPEQVAGPVSYQFERLVGKKKQTVLGLGFTPFVSGDERFQYYTFPITLTRITSPLNPSHF